MKTISALLVHESEIFLDILGKLVADISGPKITTVKTCAGFRGVIALARASNSNLVIHDLGLPNLRGLPTIHKLRYEIPNIIIIALTSVVSAAYKAEAIQAGANKVIYTGSIFWELELPFYARSNPAAATAAEVPVLGDQDSKSVCDPLPPAAIVDGHCGGCLSSRDEGAATVN